MKVIAKQNVQSELRKLPSVDRLLKKPSTQTLLQEHSHDLVVTAIQEVLADTRQAILDGETCPDTEDLCARVTTHLSSMLRPSLYPVINATGVIIHTNLGRAPLSQVAQEAMRETSAYSNLEYDLPAGKRGSRYVHAEALLRRLTGAEAGLVVNNDAAAVLLILTALAKGREVIISRGQLVEIGGGFRIPEVMAQSGAHLVEVGTTNRTYLRDYEAAITPNTAMLLHVHSSNFRILGFVHETPLTDMVNLAHAHGLLAVEDLGSGALLDTAQFGLSHEPTVQESLATGVDLVCFSGDKLLGGPQAGIIIGKKSLIEILKRHPLTRALRVSKSVIAGLQATLIHYLKGEAIQQIPVWQMMAMPMEHIQSRALALATWLREKSVSADVTSGWSTVGGGSLPGETLPTYLVAIHVDAPQELAKRLRLGSPSVLGRIEKDSFVLDLRTVLPTEEAALRKALEAVF
ncbi:MAG: L-seryl-tRNA(Sec) selenium transferase [Chloroflexi bacterium]|nr:L-seryl-tRNA(Sec) selenium transferase [Chloroflexota bacterium]